MSKHSRISQLVESATVYGENEGPNPSPRICPTNYPTYNLWLLTSSSEEVMQEQAIKRLSNEQLLPEFKKLQQDIDGCILRAGAKQAQMHGRFGTFELTMGTAELQKAKLWIDQVVFRLGYKPHGE